MNSVRPDLSAALREDHEGVGQSGGGASLHVPGTTFAIALPEHPLEGRGVAVRKALIDARTRLESPSLRVALSAHIERLEDALSGRVAIGYAGVEDGSYTAYLVLEPSGELRPATVAEERWALRRCRVETIGRKLEANEKRLFWLGLAVFAAQYLLVVVVAPDVARGLGFVSLTNPTNPLWLVNALLWTAPWWALYLYGAWLAIWVRLHAGKGVKL